MLPLRHLALAALLITSPRLFAQTPTFNVVNTSSLDSTFGNAGKGVLEPQSRGFAGVAYGNGLFVAVGISTGESVVRWATSPDGTTWTGRSQPTPAGTTTFQTSKVHFLNGKFIFFTGFGDNSSVAGTTWCYSSTDALTWTANKVTDNRINVGEFDASPNLYVAAGQNGNQYASTDLVTWVPRPVVPNASGFDHLDLAYGAGKFFSSINGFGGTTYASTDAVTWTALPVSSAVGGSRVEAGNGFLIFTVSGSQYKSTDGVTFTKLTLTAPTGWFAPGGSPRFTSAGFVATGVDLTTGKTGYMVSNDAVAWTPVGYMPANPAAGTGFISRSYFISDITYGNGKYVGVGQDTSQSFSVIQNMPLIISLAADALPPPPTPPTVTVQPIATNGVLGGTATFSVIASGSGNTYQWRKDNAPIAGATSSTLTLTNLSANSAGNYSVVITNSAGTITSSAAALALVSASNSGRLVNMSIRTNVGTGDNVLIVGVGLGGAQTNGTKAVLVRGIGPTLSTFGVTGALADPVVTAFQGSTVIAQNDDWAGGFDFSTVGAFALAGTAPKDGAIYNAAAAIGSYSIQIAGKNNATGIALAEIYDATPTSSFSAATPRLVNVSARTQVGTGDNILIAGFVVGGSTPVRVLVRAAGPALNAFGVGGVLANPKLEVFGAGGAKVAENDDWQGTAELKAAAAAVSAFAFASDTSRDAALIATLPAGSYTAQVSGVGGTTGVALVELYELP